MLCRGLLIEDIGEAIERVDVWWEEPGMKPSGNIAPEGPMR